MITNHFSVHLNRHAQYILNNDLVEFILHIVATEEFDSARETFEFFNHQNRQYVIRSQKNPEQCKGYPVPDFVDVPAVTVHLKKEEGTICLFT